MISPSTTQQILSKFTKANLLAKGIPTTNGDYKNSDKDIFIQKTSIKPLKRLKTSQIDSLNKTMPTSDIYMSQYHDNKHLAEQFFFQSHPFSDLILNVQDKELYVDKSVLSTVSKVFQSYFHDENINSIDIVDVSSNDMIELLQFLYPQFQCTINYENVTILLILAHRFEIHFISIACRAFILLYLSKFNYIHTHSNDNNLIEQEDGSRLTISSILDSLCKWFGEFFYIDDDIVCQALLNKLSQCNISNFNLSKAFNQLKEELQCNIFQARAKYLEKSWPSPISSMK